MYLESFGEWKKLQAASYYFGTEEMYDMAGSVDWRVLFGGWPYDQSPTSWGLYWGPGNCSPNSHVILKHMPEHRGAAMVIIQAPMMMSHS